MRVILCSHALSLVDVDAEVLVCMSSGSFCIANRRSKNITSCSRDGAEPTRMSTSAPALTYAQCLHGPDLRCYTSPRHLHSTREQLPHAVEDMCDLDDGRAPMYDLNPKCPL